MSSLSRPNAALDDAYCLWWESIMRTYMTEIVSPWHPTMGNRNLLAADLKKTKAGETLIDLGCGPGNLVESVAGTGLHVTGIDWSWRALEISRQKASLLDVNFTGVKGDIYGVFPDLKADHVVSVNSILPLVGVENGHVGQRHKVVEGFKSVKRLLAPEGTAYLILPAWEAAVQDAKLRLSDGAPMELYPEALGVKDDSDEYTCFHSLDSMTSEMRQAGLSLIGDPQKILYPWELVKDYGYGDHAGQPETFDWYVKVRQV